MTAVIILAAGASTRMGEPKQLVKLGGKSLLEHALDTANASGLAPVIVVLGANADLIQREINFSSAHIVLNDRWSEGMATSLAAGIAAADAAGSDAAVVTTGDMPFVAPAHLVALATRAKELQGDVASAYNEIHGIPACFLRSSFATISTLTGDTGARTLLRNAPAIELPNPTDIDTTEDLRRVATAVPILQPHTRL